MSSIIFSPFIPIFLQKFTSSSQIALASLTAIFNISLLLTPFNFLYILSTAHFKLIAVGLDFIKFLQALSKKDCSLFSIKANTMPYAAVAPIRGAPLTSITFIALIASSNDFNSLI